MADDKHYVPGDFYRICDRTGFKVRAGRTRKEWTNSIVRTQSFEQRHPQDFVRGVPDYQNVPDPRPRQTDQFINQKAGNGGGQLQVFGDNPLGPQFLVQNNRGPAYNPGQNSDYLNPSGTAQTQDLNGTIPVVDPANYPKSG